MKLAKINITPSLIPFQQIVEEDLAKVDTIIKNLLVKKEGLIVDISNYLLSLGGKRLRPMLTIICSKLLENSSNERHIGLAASVELIHTATLLHDDVVDGSALRRGKKTSNEKWGNKESILVGDFLLSQAFRLMVKDGSPKVLDVLSLASSIIAEGEVMQISSTNNLKTTQEEYIKIITAKTAELFAASCQVGGMAASMPINLEMELRSFGNYLGIAFQIIDDVLDYSAKEQELGKAIGDDFREGKITLPIIFAYENTNEEGKDFLNKTMSELEQSEGDLEKALNLIKNSGALTQSIEIARKYLFLAEEKLAFFPNSLAKEALQTIVKYSLERSY